MSKGKITSFVRSFLERTPMASKKKAVEAEESKVAPKIYKGYDIKWLRGEPEHPHYELVAEYDKKYASNEAVVEEEEVEEEEVVEESNDEVEDLESVEEK
jgi:hypothetical protein